MDTLQYILETQTTNEFIQRLQRSRCTRCSLSEHDNQIVVSRGIQVHPSIMLVGEAPGAVEDQDGIPFSGPAGQLLDKAFAAAGINTNLQMYLSNIVRCRPIAAPSSGKQNYTPKTTQRLHCLPFLLHEIKLVDAPIVVACGAVAAETLFEIKPAKMNTIGGTVVTTNRPELIGRVCYVMHHPAWVLHQSSRGGEEFTKAKRILWEEILKLKQIAGL